MTRNNKRLPTAEQLRALLEVWQEIEGAQQAAEDTGRPVSCKIIGGNMVTIYPIRCRTIGADGLDDLGDFVVKPQETS